MLVKLEMMGIQLTVMAEAHHVLLKLIGVVLELQVFDIDEEMASWILEKAEMTTTIQIVTDEAQLELLSLDGYDQVVQVFVLTEEMEL